ncbi:sensor histidine kinase [Streptomyces sp. NPDC127074]|uniref:sensor histidine kinase n=1 Tax=Streptomyces sp. NPDC127074 TaxID=3347130 RepID=UPI003668D614
MTATAWLTAQSTTTAIQERLGQVMAGDARTYRTLLTFAVEHRDWSAVRPVVAALARKSGRRIVLATESRQVIADSGVGGAPVRLPGAPSAVVDALTLDVRLARQRPANQIDPRVVGPFALSRQDKTRLDRATRIYTRCLTRYGNLPAAGQSPAQVPAPAPAPGQSQLPVSPSGHPIVNSSSPLPRSGSCADSLKVLDSPTAGESAALKQLNELVNGCLAHQHRRSVKLTLDRSWQPALLNQAATAPVSACFASARRDQLRPYAAPGALLFVTDPNGVTTTGGGLSSDGLVRIELFVAIVLVLTVGVSVALGLLLIRPLRAVTTAARRMRAGDISARVQVHSRDEIGQLARAFNEMAEHRERTEDQRKAMVSDISHELRTPLGTVRSVLEASKDGVIELDQSWVSSLLGEALMLQHLVDDLQDLALADAGKLTVHPEPVDLHGLWDQLLTMHRGQARAQGTTLTAELEGDPELSADPVRLRQILTNLVTNALRYTPPGGAVRLAARRDGEQVQITVSDTGTGIAEQDLPHVFDRFWRADRSRTRDTGGSGLGLAIVHNLVRAHHGSITVHSTIGQGTTFIIRLPR